MSNTFQTLNLYASSTLFFLQQRGQLLNRLWRDELASAVNQGASDTVSVRTPPSFTAASYNGSSLSVQNITEGKVDVVMNNDYVVPVQWSLAEDAARVGREPMEQLVTIPAADSLLRAVESSISVALHTAFTTAGRVYGTAYGTAPDIADLADCREALNLANAPYDGRWMGLYPESAANLIQKTAFTDQSASGRNTLSTGEIGTVYGFDTFESNAIVKNTTPSPDEIYNLFGIPSVAAVAFKQFPMNSGAGVEMASVTDQGLSVLVTKQWDTASQSHVLVFRVKWGVKMLDATRGGILKG